MPSSKTNIRNSFPRLSNTDLKITSDPDDQYNCIAWAAGVCTQWWWPAEFKHWPAGVPREVTVDAFAQAFATVGFTVCATPDSEDGVEKIAIYVKSGRPTHAAFVTPGGKWWGSKLGASHDIEHRTPYGVGGNVYGEPAVFMQRSAPSAPRPKMPNTLA